MKFKSLKIMLFILTIFNAGFSQKYFLEGVECFENNKLMSADSLFTLSLIDHETYQSYFNRAITRFALNNPIAGCADLRIVAENFSDNQSIYLYNINCCQKIDTLYYNKKLEKVDNTDFKYYEIIKVHKYNNDTTGSFHKKNGKYPGSKMVFGKLTDITVDDISTTDIYTQYYFLKGIKIYTMVSYQFPTCSSSTALEDFKSKARNYLLLRYPQLKSDDGMNSKSLVVELLMDTSGEIIKILDSYIFPSIADTDNLESIEEELEVIFNNTPKYNPIKVFRQPVLYQINLSISF